MSVNHIFIVVAIIGILYWIIRYNAAGQANVITAWHSRFVGVVPVLPLSPFDVTVSVRAENLRNAFADCGNTNVEVVEYVFGLPIGKDGTAALTFDAFLRMATVDYLQRVDAFIADKAKRDQKAAAQHIGGQTFTIIPNDQYLKN